MAKTIAASLRDNPDIKSLLELLDKPEYQSQHQEFTSILDYFETLSSKYESVMTKLDAMNEKLSGITDRKNPLAIMAERLSSVVSGIGDKLNALKDNIIDFAKNTLEAARDKGISAIGAVSETLHIHENLEAISKGLGKAAATMETLEQFHQERVSVKEAAEEAIPSEAQAVSLADLLADTRVDFENLTPNELNAVYAKLLDIGMNGDLNAEENTCLHYLIEEAEALLPDRSDFEHTRERETEIDIGDEI
jgi:hypothetical protein